MPSSDQSSELKGNVMPTPVKDGTAVTKWLTDQGAGDFFIDAFYDDGYYSMVDVNAEVINRLVTRPGLAAQLIRALPKPDPKPKRDSSVPKDGTAVTKWLKEHKAGAFVDVFYNEGYDNKEEVTAEGINRLVTPPGLAAELNTSRQGPLVISPILKRVPNTPEVPLTANLRASVCLFAPHRLSALSEKGKRVLRITSACI